MSYMVSPCPYCGNNTLCQPENHNERWFAKCDTCGKSARISVASMSGTSQNHYTVKHNGRVGDMVRVTITIRPDQLDKLDQCLSGRSDTVRAALDKYLNAV